VALIALKIDVDTYRGTREGALRLADLLQKLALRATFLFSMGPDHTGRAIKRAFRRGFLAKVQRTSVLEHYGLKTLLYGVLLPGPHIGRRCRGPMQEIAQRGFEVGVHTWDHVRWQDGVANASEAWTRRELTLPLTIPGAAAVPQLPTTLPTLDELIGRPDLAGADPVDHLLALTARTPTRDQVFTLHAELEGGRLLGAFERLLRAWQERGVHLTDLGSYVGTLDLRGLPRCAVVAGTVPGRSGTLALQAQRV
jgi:undecaprenyl phosphate-alpha-L-ara4FN deformylase